MKIEFSLHFCHVLVIISKVVVTHLCRRHPCIGQLSQRRWRQCGLAPAPQDGRLTRPEIHRHEVSHLTVLALQNRLLWLVPVQKYEGLSAVFSARQHAEHAVCCRKSVYPSVCPSHGWINRKLLKLGSCSFHHTVVPSLYFFTVSFIQKFWLDPPEQGHQTRVGNLTVAACMKFNTWCLHSLEVAVIVRHGVCTYFSTNSAELTWSAKLIHYFAINNIHAEIYSAVVYFSDSVLK